MVLSLVAAVTAATAATVPLLVGLVTGDRPAPIALAGAVVAVLAVAYVLLEPIGADAGPWLLLGVRAGSPRRGRRRL